MQRRTLLSLVAAFLRPALSSADEAPATMPKGKERPDGAVLQVVLETLLTDPQSPLEPRRAERKQIFVSADPLLREASLETVLLRHDAKQWAKLSPEQVELTQLAAKDLARRAVAREHFQNFEPKDPRIILYTKADEEKAAQEKDARRRVGRPQVFHAYPPGYSANGNLAVVHLEFPWSGGFHSGNATFVLAAQPKEWTLLMRQFTLYV